MDPQGETGLEGGRVVIGLPARELSPPAIAAARRSLPLRLAQVLVVFGLLAGLFGMHGFGIDHAMPRSVDQATAMTMAIGFTSVVDTHGVESVAVSAHVPGLQTGHGAPDQQMDMGQACLAVLAAVALVVLLLSPARLRRAAEVLAALPRRWATHQGLAPPRPPDLHLLCVLRT